MNVPSTVAFLFVDVVRSTELRLRLGDDLNDEVEARFMDTLRRAVARHDGMVVRSLGDGLCAAFPGAASASIGCAVDMQRSIAQLAARDPLIDLQIRVGLSVGEAAKQGDDWSGAPIVEASRLVEAALPGRILANDVMRVLVGTRGGFEFTPVGAARLKGFLEPLACSEVAWEPDPDLPEIPLPSALQPPSHPGFVGRVAESSRLLATLRESGPGVVTVVSGDEGSGRRRLVAEVARRVRGDELATVLHGRCDVRGVPAAGLVEAIRWWIAGAPTGLVRGVLGDRLDRLAALIPSVQHRFPELFEVSNAVPDSERVISTLGGALGAVAALGPTLLVLDATDGWDAASAEIVSVARARAPALTCIVVASRAMAAEIADSMGEEEERTRLLELDGLLAVDVRQLLIDASGLGPGLIDDEIVDTVLTSTGGLPGPVLEAAARLLASGAGRVEDGPARRRALHASVIPVSPYQGLLAYTDAESDRFHGRDEEITGLLSRLAGGGLLTVSGPSGSGKSSLVRAGLVPAIRRGALVGSDVWPILMVTPGRRPLTELAQAVSVATSESIGDVLDRIEDDESALLHAMERHAPTSLLVIDQFEEVFTLCDEPAERERFIGSLLRAAAGRACKVIIVVRADFLGHCASVAGLAPALDGSMALVGPVSERGLIEIIERPAADHGLVVAPGLATLMIRDVVDQPGALPLLSHALYETWRGRSGQTLTLEAYHAAGGVRGAIAQTAESVVAELGPALEPLVRELCIRLTELGEGSEDTRRRVPLEDLASVDHRMSSLLERMIRARLVTVDDRHAEFAHEALIREWPRLRAWLDGDRDRLRTVRNIARAAAEWDRGGQDAADLLRGARLASAQDAAASAHLTGSEQAYLEASALAEGAEQAQRAAAATAQARQNRQLRRALIVAAVGLVLAVVGATLAVVQSARASDRAEQARQQTADADVQRLVSQSVDLVPTNRRVAYLLAVEAVRLRDTPETRSSLLKVLQRTRGFLGATTTDGPPVAAALLDDSTLLYATQDAALHRMDVTTGASVGDPIRIGAEVTAPTTIRIVKDPSRSSTDPVAAVRFDTGEILQISSSIEAGGTLIEAGGPILAVAQSARLGMIAVARPGGSIAVWTTGGDAVGQIGAPPDQSVPAPFLVPARNASQRYGAGGARFGLTDVEALAFSAQGRRLAVLRPGRLETWDIDSATLLGSVSIGSPQVAPDFGYVVPSNDDGLVVVADPSSFTVAAVDQVSGQVRWRQQAGSASVVAPVFLHDGELVALDDGELVVLDQVTGSRLDSVGVSQHGSQVALDSGDGREIVIVSGTDAVVERWSTKRASPIVRPVGRPGLSPLEFSPDGSMLLAQEPRSPYPALSVWDVDSGAELVAEVPALSAAWAGVDVLGVLFDPATAGRLGVPGLERQGSTVKVDAGRLTRWPFSPDKRLSATIEIDGHVTFYDADGLAPFPSIELEGTAYVGAISPQNDRLAVALSDGRLRVYDIASSRLLLDGPDDIGFVQFDATGDRLFVSTTDGRVEVLDASSGAALGPEFPTAPTPIVGLTADRTDSVIGVVDASGGARVFDARSGVQLGDDTLVSPRAGRTYVAVLHPDGISAAIETGAVIEVVDLDPGRWRTAACGLAGANLSRAEWARYLPNGGPYRRTCDDLPPGD